jgi:signal transduction histidine kinase
MTAKHREPIRILVVEDEGITAIDTSDLLQGLGYAVPATVFSGRDAVRQVEALHPDLVLMDIRLKGEMDGIAAAKEIRTRFDIPIIYATAYADDATLQRAKLTEPFGYVLKPFDERELRSSIEMALYKHRLERQRADFLAMLSHDIRNPLAVILGYTDMLAEVVRSGAAAQAEELLQRLTSTTLSVHSLVTNYLDASRIEAGRLSLAREPVPLNEVVTRIRDQYDAEAQRRGVRLEASLHEPLPAVDADPVAVERILTNLVYNALKFTPRGGRVTIGSVAHEREVVVNVVDTGPGIPPEQIPRLFERYQKAASAEREGGSGLGLFIVKTLAEAHGGRVEVDSTFARGTRFSIFLPVARSLTQ